MISIETSSSKGEIFEKFEEIRYDHGIGLGVYDIHSTRIPTEKEIILIVECLIKVINKGLFWINPIRDLKTRSYKEAIPALKNMVNVAKKLRGRNN